MKVINSLLICLIVAVTGCASLGGSKSSEDIVKERSQKRLNLLIKKDTEKAWTYTSPSYRQRISAENYKNQVAGIVSWIDAKVVQVRCEEERCAVTYDLTYKMDKFNLTNTRPMEEVWVKLENQWWIYHR